MNQTVAGHVHDYDPVTGKWSWRCGTCGSTTNDKIVLKGRQQYSTRCVKCGDFNRVRN
jgi:uncharacterized Zn finger protein